MKVGKPKTEKELAESLWWWQHSRFAEPPDPANAAHKPLFLEWRDWKDGLEQTAQEWELVRRYRPDLNWPPFYEIGSYIARNLRDRLIKHRLRSAKKITTEPAPAGWTDPDAKGWRWNLGCTEGALKKQYILQVKPTKKEMLQVLVGSLTNEDLRVRLQALVGSLTVKEFRARLAERRQKQAAPIAKHLRWIHAQAESQGLKLPSGLSGQRNQRISWTWIEVWDTARYGETKHSKYNVRPFKRTMKAKAINAAKKLWPRYDKALAEILETPGVELSQTPELRGQFRRIILGRWGPKTNQ